MNRDDSATSKIISEGKPASQMPQHRRMRPSTKDGKQRMRRAPAELPAQPDTGRVRRIGNKSKMQPSRAALGQPEDKRRYNALRSRIQPPHSASTI
jgi:hypothetical protein